MPRADTGEQALRLALGSADQCEHSVDLYDFAAGQMPAAEAQQFQSHLAQCRECRLDLEQFRSTESSWEGRAATRTKRPRLANRMPVMAGLAAAGLAAILLSPHGSSDAIAPDLIPKGRWTATLQATETGPVLAVSAPTETNLAAFLLQNGGSTNINLPVGNDSGTLDRTLVAPVNIPGGSPCSIVMVAEIQAPSNLVVAQQFSERLAGNIDPVRCAVPKEAGPSGIAYQAIPYARAGDKP